MSVRLPLFPLGTVLFPGLPLPLHIFEERYRLLVRELIDLPADEPRRFGVVAIREGREVGADGVRALHEVGCTADLRQVQAYPDGRYDIVTTGSARFVVRELDDSAPYLQGEVELLGEQAGEVPAGLSQAVAETYAAYLDALGASRGEPIEVPEIPDDPLLLSYLVAATVLVDVHEKQRLLEAVDAATRLRAELAILRRESKFVGLFGAVPPTSALNPGASPN